MTILPDSKTTGDSSLDEYGLDNITRRQGRADFVEAITSELKKRTPDFNVIPDINNKYITVEYFDLRVDLALNNDTTRALNLVIDGKDGGVQIQAQQDDNSNWKLVDKKTNQIFNPTKLCNRIVNTLAEKLPDDYYP